MDIVHDFRIKTTAQKLYEAITTENGIHGWWAKDADVGRNTGEISRMRFAKEAGAVEMHFRIDAMVPSKRVSWTCVKNPNPAWIDTMIDLEIDQVNPSEVNFRFNHSHWDPKWKGQLPYEQTKEGWNHFMISIKEYCETGVGQPW